MAVNVPVMIVLTASWRATIWTVEASCTSANGWMTCTRCESSAPIVSRQTQGQQYLDCSFMPGPTQTMVGRHPQLCSVSFSSLSHPQTTSTLTLTHCPTHHAYIRESTHVHVGMPQCEGVHQDHVVGDAGNEADRANATHADGHLQGRQERRLRSTILNQFQHL